MSQNLLRADGTYTRLLAKLARVDVLVLDDLALTPLQEAERRDLLEVLEDPYGTRSTIVTSQMPPNHWHEAIGDPTLAWTRVGSASGGRTPRGGTA